MITINNITKEYSLGENKISVLDNINFQFKKGEIVSIIGPSGCGKTTLLKLIAGLMQPTTGSIDSYQLSSSIVFQNPVLLPWRSVKDNIALACELTKKQTDTQGLIDLVDLKGFEHHYPSQLSGGMQQRVNLARALTLQPQLLLMDEPFGALDEITKNKLHLDVLNIWNTLKPTIILITHSISEAVFLSDRVLVLSALPATIKEIIDIDLVRPRTLSLKETQQFQNYVSWIRKTLE